MIVTESKTWENSTEKIENPCRVLLLLSPLPFTSLPFLQFLSLPWSPSEKTSLQLSETGPFSLTLLPTLLCFSVHSSPTVVSISLDSSSWHPFTCSFHCPMKQFSTHYNSVMRKPFCYSEENWPLRNFHLLVLFFLSGSTSQLHVSPSDSYHVPTKYLFSRSMVVPTQGVADVLSSLIWILY